MNHPIPPEADIDDVATEAAPQLWRRWLKFLPLAVIVALVGLFFATGMNRYLSTDVAFEMLGQQRQSLKATVAAHPARSVLIYMVAYMVLVAFSIPGAMFMTMAGGFLFGPWLGTASAVVGMTCGASIMFFVARTALGGLLRRSIKAGGLIEKIQAGVEANAFTYLLVLRLIPAVPFWLCNIASGFVPIPVRTYLIATVLGIIPSTLVYSGFGSGLDHVFDLGQKPDMSIMTNPRMMLPLIGLCLLSVIPLVFHAWKVRRRRATEAS